MPAFTAEFMSLLLPRVCGVLEANLNAVLAEIDGTLLPFQEFRTPMPLTTIFQSLYVEPVRSRLNQSDNDSFVKGTHEISVLMAIRGDDPRGVRDMTMKYVLAVDRTLRQMTANDLIDAVSPSRCYPVWEVTDHDFGVTFKDNTTYYRRDAGLTLVVQLTER